MKLKQSAEDKKEDAPMKEDDFVEPKKSVEEKEKN